jgi:hypothetical protein
MANVPAVQHESQVALRSPLRAIAGVWLLMLRRRWRHESSIGLAALAFAGFLTVIGRGNNLSDPAIFTTLLVVALGNAVIIATSIGGEPAATALRLALLPLAARTRLIVRVLFAAPLRVVVFALVLAWSVIHLSAMGLPAARLALELAQAALLVAAAALLSVIWTEPLKAGWMRVSRSAFTIVNFALTVGVLALHWGAGMNDRLAPNVRAPLLALEIGRVGGRDWRGTGWEFAAIATYAVVAGFLLVVARRVSLGSPAQARGGSGGPSVLARLGDMLTPPLRKEVLLLFRMRAVLQLIGLTFALFLLALGVGMPGLLAGLPLLWFGFFLNALGADIPEGGLVRYHVSGLSLRRVLAWRQLAVLLTASASGLLAAIALAVSLGIARPVNGGSRWLYVALYLFGAATLLISAVPANRIALKHPLPRKRLVLRANEAGPASLIFWIIGAAVMVVLWSLVALALGGVLLRSFAPAAGEGWVMVMGAAVTVAAYCVAIRRGWHAAG